MKRSIEEINEKIRSGSVVVKTAEEIIGVVKEQGVKKAAEKVDVVTTGTFSPMCSSGAFLNVKQPRVKMKFGGGWVKLNEVPAYAGLAAADIYIGATALPDNDPRNNNGRPGRFRYGGAHVIEDFVAGRRVQLSAGVHGTDCYPEKYRRQSIDLNDTNDAILLNPRNGYQNYNVAVNLSDKTIYTYMGKLKPQMGNANYCSAGQLSPLLNDPLFRTIGIGTRIFFCGAQGYVIWNGTQHNADPPRSSNGTPRVPAGNLALLGNMKDMQPQWLRAVSFSGYGVSLSVAIGVPIPIIDEEMMRFVSVTDEAISAPVVDYSRAYPYGEGPSPIAEVTYGQLRSGLIEIDGRKVPTGCFSSYNLARKVADHLKTLVVEGKFRLTQPVAHLPGSAS